MSCLTTQQPLPPIQDAHMSDALADMWQECLHTITTGEKLPTSIPTIDITRDVQFIQFGIASQEEIKKQAVCEVNCIKLSGPKSVYDPVMGTMEQNEKCVSCGELSKDCPGHFGYIALNTEIAHPMYMRHITNFLKCICHKCSRVALTKDHLVLDGILKYSGESRFEKCVERLDKVEKCEHCGNPRSKVTYQQKTGEIMTRLGNTKMTMLDSDMLKFLKDIPKDDVELLGFPRDRFHPRNLIITNLPVIPPRARPYVISDNNVTCDDDLTSQYVEIIKLNIQLKDALSQQRRDNVIQRLKFRIKTLMNNSQGKSKCTSGRPYKGIKERLQGKDGLIRSNLMGKRRNQSARSVISADPTVRTDEIVIPEYIANNLTMPEIVAAFNINILQDMVNKGKVKSVKTKEGHTFFLKQKMLKKGTPIHFKDKILRKYTIFNASEVTLDMRDVYFTAATGVYHIVTRTNKDELCANRKPDDQVIRGVLIDAMNKQDLELRQGDTIIREGKWIRDVKLPERLDYKLKIGDVVERHLKNGDIVLFNRQPTLHQASMLAKRIIIRPCRTFRFNLASTKTFNADFDGDEMNIFLPQGLDARAELFNLSTTKHNIMTVQSSKNVICITQDSLLGAFLLTRDDEDLGRDKFFDICMKGDGWTPDYILKRLDHIEQVKEKFGKQFPTYCGKALFSLMLPDTLNYSKKTDARKDEPVVKIVQGVMLEGALAKGNLGQAHNSIVHVLYKEYGMDCSIDFLNNCQFITNQYLVHRSFSVGIRDCVSTIAHMNDDVAYKCFEEVRQIQSTISHQAICELRTIAALNKGRDETMKLAKQNLSPDNAFVATVTSGSKGEYFNISQITSMLGQQMHMGKRIEPTLNRGKRTLPHYPKEAGKYTTLQQFESRGFIKNSFLHGLNPQEFVWHAMSGREGCSDSSMKTANSGYIQRKMIKVLEDIQVKYDGTVRNTNNWVIQWAYGGDGFDRAECAFNSAESNVFFADVQRIADRLNNEFELDMLR